MSVARFHFYAAFIKHLRLLSLPNIHPAVYLRLAAARAAQSTCLLPMLQSLEMYESTPLELLWFLAPGLTHVVLETDGSSVEDANAAAVLDGLAQVRPNLERLELQGHLLPPSLEVLSGFFNLRALRVMGSGESITDGVLRVLGQLEKLETLEVDLAGMQSTNAVEVALFPALEKLHIKGSLPTISNFVDLLARPARVPRYS